MFTRKHRSLPVLALAAALLVAAIGGAARAEESPEQAALRTLDAFMAAFNARDVEGWIATLHFPHVRIAGGQVAVFEDAAAFRNNFEFARFAEQTGWSRSEWSDRRVVQAGPDKVHVAVVFTRFRADGGVLARYESFYVVTKSNGRWGVQARSSYAP
ncbi:MAG TPA: hypothetical protein VFT98_06855 [Myxococcota bacterium]|nr:hypothetical protein [Myxococcota bacterium]